MASAEVMAPITVISCQSRWFQALRLSDLWAYRELLWFLVWRDIKVRYKQAVLGVAWAVIQPVATVLIFTLFFGRLAKIPSDNLPYPLFALAAMLPWNYFTGALTRGSQSLVGASHLISKVYFPRLTVPISAVLSGLVDYAITWVVLIVVMAFYGFYPSWDWLLVAPALTLLTLGLALGLSLWLSALNVKYRDVSHVLPFMVQLWMFATPIVYPLSLVPEKYQWLVSLNPMTGVIESFRLLLLHQSINGQALMFSLGIMVVILISGAIYFSKTERSFADVI